MSTCRKRTLLAGAILALAPLAAFAGPGAVYTTTKTGTAVNKNIYATTSDVYVSGGPQNMNAAGLADGTYYFQVTDPSGKTLLSNDNAVCRQLLVAGGRVSGPAGPCPHAAGTFNGANGATPVQLAPYSQTPNRGAEYKVWIVPTDKASIGADPRVLAFSNGNAKTDNFKTREAAVPVGSCQPSSSLSVMVRGTDVVSYVPKGSWSFFQNDVAVVNVEGSSVVPQLIATPSVVNSCASNSVTGRTVCTANNTDVYLLSGVTLDATLTSGGTGTAQFSGGTCTNCGVAMDAIHNRAVIALAVGANMGGYQLLDLAGAPTLAPPFASMAPPGFFFANISEDILIDPFTNLILSPAETSNFELVDVAAPAAPQFYERQITPFLELDSAGEDCSTGIALAPAEFSGPSAVYIADLTQAVFTPGAPGTWTDVGASQVQFLSESFLSAGASGVAIAQGTHSGVVTGEFFGDAVTAVMLPATSGTGMPAVTDWITCAIGGGFQNGLDPHTVTAYQSPSSGDAIAVLANFGATMLAVVDVTKMLDPAIVPRTPAGHACATSPLPPAVVRFISVPSAV